ncbi:MAG: site-specific integrase [Actinomycetota bacterium]|nr:site-specific integrase [Actinomycetota bacterium]
MATFQAFRVLLRDDMELWTVVDDDYVEHGPAASFLVDCRLGRGFSPGTCRMYAGELAAFLTWLSGSDRSLEQGATDLSRFVALLRTTATARRGSGQGRPPGAARINHYLGAIREFYKHAVANRVVDGVVLAHLYQVADDRWLPADLRGDGQGLRYVAKPRHHLKPKRQERVKLCSDEEFEAMLGVCLNWRDRFLLVLLWFTGLRIGEALGLRRSDMHFCDDSTELDCRVRGPHLHVVPRENSNGARVKSLDERWVPANHFVTAYHDRYWEERERCKAADACDFVFVNLWRQPLGAPIARFTGQELVPSLARRAGVHRSVTAHMLRHAMATTMIEQGTGTDVVQAILGQRSAHSTEIYLHANEKRKREAVDRLSASFPGKAVTR